MVKLSPELKNEIIEKLNNGASTGQIMNEYKLSRSTVQRFKNNNSSKNETKSNISSNDDINELFDDLHNNEEEEENNLKMTDQKIPEKMTDQPIQQIDDTFHNIRGKIDVINKLDLFDEKPKINYQPQPQPRQNIQPTQNINIKGTDKDYIQKQNLISKCKRFVQSFPNELSNITGGNNQLFCHRLYELECHQLEILLKNIQFEINQPRVSQLFNTIFFTSINQIEHLSGSFGFDVNGMTEVLQKNDECLNALKELNCLYDISGFSSPELRLLMCVLMTGMNCYSNNKINHSLGIHLDKPIEEDIKEKYKNL